MQPCSRRSLLGAVFGLVAALGAWGAHPARAVGRRLDLATMTERAGTIVSGRIIELREGRHPQYHNIRVLSVTLQVNEMIKGAITAAAVFLVEGFALIARQTPSKR